MNRSRTNIRSRKIRIKLTSNRYRLLQEVALSRLINLWTETRVIGGGFLRSSHGREGTQSTKSLQLNARKSSTINRSKNNWKRKKNQITSESVLVPGVWSCEEWIAWRWKRIEKRSGDKKRAMPRLLPWATMVVFYLDIAAIGYLQWWWNGDLWIACWCYGLLDQWAPRKGCGP